MARQVAESSSHASAPPPDPGSAWAGVFAGLGVQADDKPEAEPVYLWPDNVLSWNCWQSVQTQWRTGMGGATGLDYAGVRAYLDEMDLGLERRDVFTGIQACERATLDVWGEQREREAANKRN